MKIPRKYHYDGGVLKITINEKDCHTSMCAYFLNNLCDIGFEFEFKKIINKKRHIWIYPNKDGKPTAQNPIR